MSYRTLDDLDDGQRVLARFDLNSPVSVGVVEDNRRFARHARTVRELVDAGHRVALLAHQGRPGRDTFVTLEQHADILAEYLDHPVEYVPDTYGQTALDAIEHLDASDVILLENVRMTDDELPERDPEEHSRSDLVQTLAPEFDAYVGDAYSAAHRRHASIVGFPLVMDAYAGRVMAAEYEANSAIATREFDGEVTMVAGGTKATDVIEVMTTLRDKVDNFLLGGVVGELFLRAVGYDVGRDIDENDLYESQWLANREKIADLIENHPSDLVYPTDLAYADGADERAEVTVAEVKNKDHDYLDVGSDTAEQYADIAANSEAVFVKGALGMFEDERFSDGTTRVLDAIAQGDCFSVVGGGDTSRAIEMYGMDEADFSHVSIAGGAYINALTGQPLPGVEVLKDDGEW
ncbi:phosphoglycerate kinase [Halovenus aranensis]|uniref:Phosphoglycerate kinase n=1 Tax=Halovenus aranensis TaxID=890420 RepID=A0A1G8S4I4_9EURY|nr:phosphoglycerate kinase [Halovenus aranensis]SDJ23570.1 phosphoglycerate kinase [Halovenus aranensis]